MVQTTISLRVSLTRNKKGLNLEASTKFSNKPTKRHYHLIEGLKNPCFDYWDKRTQQFTNVTADSVYNNELLINLLSKYRELASTGMFSDGNELFAHNTNEPIKGTTQTTLGDFLKMRIEEMKNESSQMPSKNYQCYITLLHKLELEKNIINVPLLEFDNKCFIQFAQFIKEELDGVNFISLLTRLKAIYNQAKQNLPNMKNIVYSIKKNAPRNSEKTLKKAKEGVNVLTLKQYAEFKSLELSTVPHSNNVQYDLLEMYRDFCIFLYEIKSRPVDVVKMRLEDITTIKGKKYLQYIATKKKNYVDDRDMIVQTPITPTAAQIIKKYKEKSSKGYIFPFSMNEYNWDLKNSVSFNKWNNRKAKTLEQINVFLHKLEPILKAKNLTTYVFRHSTFTHKINEPGCNILQLAKEGGTSVEMLEKHYYNHTI